MNFKNVSRVTWLVALLGCAIASPQAASADVMTTAIRMTDVTAASGIDFTTTAGRNPSTQIVEVKGGGLALIDFDNDGDLDLFIPNGATLDSPNAGPGCRLYENISMAADGIRFRDVTEKAGLSFNRWGTGVAVGDYDADGFDDIFIACFGRNALLRNRGDGTFEEITEKAGLVDDHWSTGCAFGDIDADGDLDLYVANYIDFDISNPPPHTEFLGVEVFAGPKGLPPVADRLYENLGDGAFRDISESSGIHAVPPAYGLGVVILDFDQDGRQDIFVGNDSMTNYLFRNLGENRFADIGASSGIATNAEGSAQATMGLAVADVDGNGFPDLLRTNFSDDTNTLHLNRGDGFFDDRTMQYGLGVVTRPFLKWAAMFYDFDLDADEDLLIVNGHVYPHATRATMNSDYLQTPLLFERRGRRFERVTDPAAGDWLAQRHCDRNAVFGDLDHDGDIDVIIGELNGPVRVIRNDAPAAAAGNWLAVELRDARPGIGNRHAVGAKVELVGSDPSQTQRRWIFGGGSFQSACPPVAHFGLPAGWKPSDSLVVNVTWPDGKGQRVEGVQPGQRLVISRQP